jgi:putative transposase
MRHVQRYYVPNATVFITAVTRGRRPVFEEEPQRQLLFDTMRAVQSLHAFRLVAYVVLPDHLHWLMVTPAEVTFSEVMHSIKRNFSLNLKSRCDAAGTVHVWQERFWDHVIRDEEDLSRHLDYVHYNPVKHGLVARPEEWVCTSYQHWLERGCYEVGWGWSEPESVREMEIE